MLANVQDLLELCVAQLFESVADERSGSAAELVANLLPAARAAKAAELSGLALLLGLQLRALTELARQGKSLAPDDLLVLAGWLSDLQLYLSGQQAESETPILLDALKQQWWLPSLKPELHSAILAQLARAPWLQDSATPATPAEPAMPEAQTERVSDPQHELHPVSSVSAPQTEFAEQPNAVTELEPTATPSLERAPLADPRLGAALFAQADATHPDARVAEQRVSASPDASVTPPPGYDPREPWSMHATRSDARSESELEAPESIRWIAAEELEMLAQAFTAQLLPVTQEVYSCDPEQLVGVLQRIADEAHMIGQAFEVMNLPQLKFSVDQLETNLELLGADPDAWHEVTQSVLGDWPLLLLATLEQPGDESIRGAFRDGLCSSAWPLPFDDAAWAALERELLEIRFGYDPAMVAARKSEATPEDVKLEFAEDLTPAVLEGMLRELPGNVAELSARVHALVKSASEDDIDVACRIAHTLKGDANIVGLRGIANLTHALEDILIELKRQPIVPQPALADALIEASDCVEAMADYVMRRGPLPDQSLDVYQHILHWANLALDKRLQREEPAADGHASAANQATQAAATARPALPPSATSVRAAAVGTAGGMTAGVTTGGPAESIESVATMNVPVPVLDQLLRLAGESMVVTRQLEQLLSLLKRQHREMIEGARLSERLHQELEDLVGMRGAALNSAQTSAGGMDPLELDQYNNLHTVSTRLIEASADQKGQVAAISRALTDFNELLAEQDQVQDTLQVAVLRTRMVPVDSLAARLKRTVRQTARAVLKECELTIDGIDLQIDSDILSGLTDPLMHALRNAVDHGIEGSDERRAAGKPEHGSVNLRFARDGAFVSVEISDDGRGLDLERIRAKAIEKGLITVADQLDDEQMARLILLPGFSTREQASQVSGRGIGMDVVASEVRALKGTLQLHSTAGQGMRLAIRVPASLLAAQVLVCDLPSGRVAIATDRIERLQMVQPFELSEGPNGLRIQYLGQYAAAYELDALCFSGDIRQGELGRNWIGIVLRDLNGKPVVVLAPALGEAVNVLIKPLGRYATHIPGVRGACVLGDGGAVSVVDLPDLIADRVSEKPGSRKMVERVVRTLPRALIADDSLSVRRALSQLLQDAGYEVAAVRDGLEALGELNRQLPDIMLVDLEMPQLNGLEVCSFIRSTDSMKHIPVIMITSRSGQRHQQMAKDAGVDVLVTKPYSDDFVLQTVQQLLAR